MGIVEVVGGVDTHADFHVAAAVDANGGVVEVERFPASVEGYECLLAWLNDLGQVCLPCACHQSVSCADEERGSFKRPFLGSK